MDADLTLFPLINPLDPNSAIPQELKIPVPVDIPCVGSGEPGICGREDRDPAVVNT